MLESSVFETALGAAHKFFSVKHQVGAAVAVETEEGASLGAAVSIGGVIMGVDAQFLQRGQAGIVEQFVHALDVGVRKVLVEGQGERIGEFIGVENGACRR